MIEKAARKILARCEKKFERDFGKKINIQNIVVSNRLIKTWAQAEEPEGERTIKISRKIFEGKTHTDAFRDTIIHEFCHHADHKLYGGWGHGHNWQYLMVHFGQTPEAFATEEHEKELNKPIAKRK